MRILCIKCRKAGLFVISIGKTHFQISAYSIELLGMNFRNVVDVQVMENVADVIDTTENIACTEGVDSLNDVGIGHAHDYKRGQLEKLKEFASSRILLG